MIECLVALSIAGVVMAGAVAVAGRVVPNQRVKQAASDVASTLRAARTKAIQDGATVTVPFDVEDGSFILYARGAPGDTRVRTSTSGGTTSMQRLGVLPDRVRFVRPDGQQAVTLQPPSSSDTTAQFSSKGMLQSTNTPGFVYIGYPTKNLYKRVRVSVVGSVTVETWNGSKWS